MTVAWQGLEVIVTEKARALGGATAWSGGWMWAPLNPLSQADGIVEDPDRPRTYLGTPSASATTSHGSRRCWPTAGTWSRSSTGPDVAPDRVSGTRDRRHPGPSPRRRAPAAARSAPSPSTPAGCARTCALNLRPQLYETSFLGMGIMAGPDLQAFLHATTPLPRSFFHAAWRVAFHTVDLATHRQGMQLVNGPALVARPMKSADDLGVRLWAGPRAQAC